MSSAVKQRGLVDNLFLALAFVIINSLIVYFFLLNVVFLVIAGIAFAISIVVFISLSGRRNRLVRVNIENIKRTSLRDSLGLVRHYLFLNRRYIVASALGLILACVVITQSTVIVSSYQQYAFQDYIEGSEQFGLKFSANDVSPGSIQTYIEYYDNVSSYWYEDNNIDILNNVIYPKVNFEIMMGEKTSFGARLLDTYGISTRTLTQEYLDLLKELPTFPQDLELNDIDSLLVVPNSVTYTTPEFGSIQKYPMDYINQTDNGYEFSILVDEEYKLGSEAFNTSIPFNNITSQASHVWTYTRADSIHIFANQLKFPRDLIEGSYFVRGDVGWDLYSQLNQTGYDNGERDYVWGDIGFEGYIHIAIPTLNDMDIARFNSILTTSFDVAYDESYVEFRLMSPIIAGYPIQIEIYSPLQILVEEYMRYEDNLVNLMNVYTMPIVLISLFLYYFAISIVERRKMDIFKKMMIRGASKRNFQFMVTSEIFAYGILSPIIGFFAGIGGAYLIMNYLNLLSTNAAIPIVIPTNLYWRLPLLGMLLALDFNLPNIIKATSIEYEKLIEKENTRFVESNNLDLLVFIIAVAYWILIPYLPIGSNNATFAYQQLGFGAIVAIVITLPLLVGRYVLPAFGRIIAGMPVKLDNISLAVTNIRSHKQYTNKLIALLLISLTFSFLSIVNSTTIVDMNERITQYHLGGDIYVQNIRDTNASEWDLLAAPGVASMTPVLQMRYFPTAVEILPGERLEDKAQFNFMGIDPDTFPDTFFWEDSFADIDIQTLADRLKVDGAIAMQSNIASAFSLAIGDTYQFRFGYHETLSYPMDVAATFHSMPRLVFEDLTGVLGEDDVDQAYIITSVETLLDIRRTILRSPFYGAVLKLEDGADPAEVTDLLYERFANVVDVVVLNSDEDRVSMFNFGEGQSTVSPLARFEEQFIYSSLTTTLLVSFGLAVIGISYYASIILIERRREIGVYRALGMVRRQIQRLLLAEILLITLSSLLVALFTGLFLSEKVFVVMSASGLDTVPPFQQVVNEINILGFSLIMSVVSFIMAALPARYMARRKTGNILRGA